MNHEELLARIDDQEFAYENLGRALIAVMELHKTGKSFLDDQPICVSCRVIEFPCPTIQAIEKELN